MPKKSDSAFTEVGAVTPSEAINENMFDFQAILLAYNNKVPRNWLYSKTEDLPNQNRVNQKYLSWVFY